ncbi:MAG: TolC family protein [Bdellovibrionales bacterium]|nr:TolC family protein [Bdellovibrionales bacterium]
MPFAFLILLLGISSSDASQEPTASELDRLFVGLLKTDERAPIEVTQVARAEETYRQAIGSVLPTINALYTRQIQEKATNSIGSSIFPSGQTSARLNATQPLFRGLREYAGLRQAGKLEEAQKARSAWVLSQAYLELSSIYHQWLILKSDLTGLDQEIDANQKRLAELKANRKIGKARAAEVLSMEANLETLLAQKNAAEAQTASATETIRLITGLTPEKISSRDLAAQHSPPKKMDTLENLLTKMRGRDDLVALEKNSQAAEDAIWVNRGAHLPSVDLSGNYWFQRPGVLQSVSWDASITLSLNIFSGGVIQSQVRAGQAAYSAARLEWQRANRAAETDLRNLYLTIQSGIEQVTHLEKSDRLSQATLAQINQDHRLGLTNLFEVLQSMVQAQQAKRAYHRAKFQLLENQVRLEVLTRQRTVPTLAP